MATTTSSGKKKYKLFSVSGGDGPKPCAFFNSPAGCRLGNACTFLHSTAADNVDPEPPRNKKSSASSSGSNNRATINTNNSVVSTEESESENESKRKHVVKDPPTVAEKDATKKAAKIDWRVESRKRKRLKKKNKTNEGDTQICTKPIVPKPKLEDMNIFESPKAADFNIFESPKNSKEVKKETPTPSADTKVNLEPKEKKSKKQKTQEKPQQNGTSTVPDFRSLNLPIASFSLPTSKQEEDEQKSKKTPVAIKQEENPAPPSAPEPAPAPAMPKYPVPISTQIGQKWKDLVTETQAHPDFASCFDFNKYKDQDIDAGDAWVKSRPFGDWCADFPQAIAIDCEMCETEDPLSRQKNPNALCRISVINAENPDEVLLDTLVKPSWPVTDYRTYINGISKETLEPVQFTLRHAQAFMVALCSDQTVILGHALHNDLAAMRVEHYCVADSAMLFKAVDSDTATVSLKDMAMGILKKEMPLTHDSVNDARTALLCLDHYRENKGQVGRIVRTPKLRRGNSGGGSGGEPRNHIQLFIHRIPKVCQPIHLSKMFIEHTAIAPEKVQDIDFTGNLGKTFVDFKSKSHALLAFDALEGESEPDKSGRLQKKVYLRGGDYVRVRKMTYEPDHVFPDGSSPGNK